MFAWFHSIDSDNQCFSLQVIASCSVGHTTEPLALGPYSSKAIIENLLSNTGNNLYHVYNKDRSRSSDSLIE